MTQILCFGDSITQGYTDDLGGWTQRMRKYLDSKYTRIYGNDPVPAVGTFNLGISGDTSAGLLQRMINEITPRLLGDQTIVIIAIGTNDSIYRQNTDEVECEPEQFEKNLELLIDQARKFTTQIVFVGLLPCDESRMQPMPWSSTGKCYSNERLSLFNELIKKHSSQNGLPMIDLFNQIREDGSEKYLADGVHLNQEGHALIAYEAQSLVEKYLTAKV